MLKKSITYTDYNGTTRTEDFYFNLNEFELTKFLASYTNESTNDPTVVLNQLMASGSVEKVLNFIDDLILTAYGEKSADGRRFVKNADITNSFTQTEAYSAMMVELLSDSTGEALKEFVQGMLPSDLVSRALASMSN